MVDNPVQKLAKTIEQHTPSFLKFNGRTSMRGDLTPIIFIPIVFAVLMLISGVLILGWTTTVAPTFSIMWTQLIREGYVVNATYPSIANSVFGYEYVVIQWFPVIGWFCLLAVIISPLFTQPTPLTWLLDFLSIPIFFWVISTLNNIIVVLLNASVSICPIGSQCPPTAPTTLVSVLAHHLQPGFYFIEHYTLFAFITMLIYLICVAAKTWFFRPQTGYSSGGGAIQTGAGQPTADLGQW